MLTHSEKLVTIGAEESATDVDYPLDNSDGGMDVVVTKRYDEDPLLDSELTPPTETGSTSEDEQTGGSGWFSGIGTDFRNLAISIKDNLPPAIGGIANFVHESAMSIAAEIAEMERDGELEEARWREDNCRASSKNCNENDEYSVGSYMHLPWEIKVENLENEDGPVYVSDEDLMAKMLAISLDEGSFLGPYSPSQTEEDPSLANCTSAFILDEPRIHLIQRLLDIDENLAAMHARLSGKSGIFLYVKLYGGECLVCIDLLI